MAKIVKKDTKKKVFSKKQEVLFNIPLDNINFIIFGIGIVVILIGFYLLSVKPWDSFLSLYVAPVVLLIGYFGFFILGIFARKEWFSSFKKKEDGNLSSQEKL